MLLKGEAGNVEKGRRAQGPEAPSKPAIIEPTMEDIVDFHGERIVQERWESIERALQDNWKGI